MLRKGLFRDYAGPVVWFAKLLDVVLYLIAGLLAHLCYLGNLALGQDYQIAFLIAALLLVPVFSFFGVYQSFRGRRLVACLRSLYLAVACLMLILASIAFITKTGEVFSRAWFLGWAVSGAFLLTLLRVFLRGLLRVMRKRGWNQRRIAILGAGRLGCDLAGRVGASAWSGFKVVALLDDHSDKHHAKVGDVAVQETPDSLSDYVAKEKIDEVWLALPLEAEARVQEISSQLHHNIITVRYFPDIFGMHLLNHSLTDILGLPAVDVISSPMVGVSRLLKAVEDRVLAVLILVLISPFFLLIALLVKVSSAGPVFYRQKRVSWNGREFDMLKFRSMPVNVEVKSGAVWATEADARATKVGAFLRRTSLDELPQFINVLRGEMSIVGPRPERPVFVDQFKHEIPDYMKKHLVKAGITGWAQVNGLRGNTDLKKRIEYDLDYVQHWSFWLDLKIIYLTLFKGFVSKNAY